jgi:hypothetical protein
MTTFDSQYYSKYQSYLFPFSEHFESVHIHDPEKVKALEICGYVAILVHD